jgi:hypothetical protein
MDKATIDVVTWCKRVGSVTRTGQHLPSNRKAEFKFHYHQKQNKKIMPQGESK